MLVAAVVVALFLLPEVEVEVAVADEGAELGCSKSAGSCNEAYYLRFNLSRDSRLLS